MRTYKCKGNDCGVEFTVKGEGMASYMEEKFCPYCGSGIEKHCHHAKQYADFEMESMPPQTSWTCVKCGESGTDFSVTQEDRDRENNKIWNFFK